MLYEVITNDDGPAGDAVELCTFHRAKGLEWQRVWVCGLEQGLVPISHAKTAADCPEPCTDTAPSSMPKSSAAVAAETARGAGRCSSTDSNDTVGSMPPAPIAA